MPELWDALAAGPSSRSRVPESMQRILNDLGAGRLAAMDEAGIDVQVLSLQPPWDECDQAGIVTATRAFNDAAAAAIAAHPTRFGGLAALPTNDPRLAASELERAVTELGLHGALIGPRTHDGYIDQEHYWPIFECADGLGVPVYTIRARRPTRSSTRTTRRSAPGSVSRCQRRHTAGTWTPACTRSAWC